MTNKSFVTKATIAESNYTPAPAGAHQARCIQIIDLGTQESVFKGQVKTSRKVRFVFELVNEKHIFDPTKGPQPFVVGKEFTNSINDKSALKPILEAWRGSKFTEQEKENGVDLSVFLGKPAIVTVVHEVSKTNGKTYANIGNISGIMKGMKVPQPENELMLFVIGADDQFELFKKLPGFVQEKIKASPEFQEQMIKNLENNNINNETNETNETNESDEAPWLDDIPSNNDDDYSF